MKLPQNSAEIFTVSLGGFDLEFNKFRVGDLFSLQERRAKNPEENFVLMALGMLLNAEEETLESKIEFISNLRVADPQELTDLATEIGIPGFEKKTVIPTGD